MDYQVIVVACRELYEASLEGEDIETLGRRLKVVEERLWDMKMSQAEQRVKAARGIE
jgi:hypothetical protein